MLKNTLRIREISSPKIIKSSRVYQVLYDGFTMPSVLLFELYEVINPFMSYSYLRLKSQCSLEFNYESHFTTCTFQMISQYLLSLIFCDFFKLAVVCCLQVTKRILPCIFDFFIQSSFLSPWVLKNSRDRNGWKLMSQMVTTNCSVDLLLLSLYQHVYSSVCK